MGAAYRAVCANNGLGFFVAYLKLLLEPALAYVLLLAPVEQRYRAHSLLYITDLQSGPIKACLLLHQLSDTLALLFFAQVSRDRLLASYFVSYRTSYDTKTEAVRDFRALRQGEVRRTLLARTRVNIKL